MLGCWQVLEGRIFEAEKVGRVVACSGRGRRFTSGVVKLYSYVITSQIADPCMHTICTPNPRSKMGGRRSGRIRRKASKPSTGSPVKRASRGGAIENKRSVQQATLTNKSMEYARDDSKDGGDGL